MAIRRSLWSSISTSKKVNALSDKATILYTWSIAHQDDEGFIDGDPRLLKSTVVPLRDGIQIKDIPGLIEEIATVHTRVQSTPVPLWIVHKTSQGMFLEDPAFDDHQSFKGIRRKSSKIKDVITLETKGCQPGVIEETKGCIKGEGEVEGEGEGECETARKQKGDTPAQAFTDLFNEIVQYLPKITRTKSRDDKIRIRLKEHAEFSWWEVVFRKADLVLLPGKDGKRDWFPTFDWLIDNDKNAVKVFEGNYGDAQRPKTPRELGKSIEAANMWLKKREERDAKKGLQEISYDSDKDEGEPSGDES